jgi:hypothetical protein
MLAIKWGYGKTDAHSRLGNFDRVDPASEHLDVQSAPQIRE